MLNGKTYQQFVKGAQACLDGFGIDFDQFLPAVPTYLNDMDHWEVLWEHRVSKKKIVLTCVYADEKGRILTYGSMSGVLTL